MGKMQFEFMKFYNENTKTIVRYLNIGYFEIHKVNIIDKYTVKFSEKDEKRILQNINNGLAHLKNRIDNKPMYIINEQNPLPLVGTNFIGIVDRGTNIIEVKPLTGCNLNCIFCSVDEGTISKKINHFIVEPYYLVEEVKKFIEKKSNKVHIYINPHGEPLLYGGLIELIKGLRSIKKIDEIGIITNGVLLTEQKIDDLIKAGLTRINFSLNTLNIEHSKKIYGSNFPVDKVKKILKYSSSKITTIVAPVFLNKINNLDIEEIIKFASKNKIKLGIQNFLRYKRGRNPTKSVKSDDFVKILKKWERKYYVQLLNPDLGISLLNDPIEKLYRVKQTVNGRIIGNARYSNEYLAITDKTCIIVRSNNKLIVKNYNIRILRNKDSIYYGIIKKG